MSLERPRPQVFISERDLAQRLGVKPERLCDMRKARLVNPSYLLRPKRSEGESKIIYSECDADRAEYVVRLSKHDIKQPEIREWLIRPLWREDLAKLRMEQGALDINPSDSV